MTTLDRKALFCVVPCFVCGKELKRAFPENEAQPSGGVMCATNGNYGSRVFDPFHEQGLFFIVCDDCLVAGRERVRLADAEWVRPKVTYRPWEEAAHYV